MKLKLFGAVSLCRQAALGIWGLLKRVLRKLPGYFWFPQGGELTIHTRSLLRPSTRPKKSRQPDDYTRFSPLGILSEPPIWGRQKGVTPTCSDFPVFFRFLPICTLCFWDLFQFVLICSAFFRFVLRTNQNKSGKPLSADPFCNSR